MRMSFALHDTALHINEILMAVSCFMLAVVVSSSLYAVRDAAPQEFDGDHVRPLVVKDVHTLTLVDCITGSHVALSR